MPFSTEDYL